MILTIELSSEQAGRLKARARNKGVAPAELAKLLVTEHLTANENSTDPTIALLQSWLAEDATTDEQELKQAQEEEYHFEQAINAEREKAGARKMFS